MTNVHSRGGKYWSLGGKYLFAKWETSALTAAMNAMVNTNFCNKNIRKPWLSTRIYRWIDPNSEHVIKIILLLGLLFFATKNHDPKYHWKRFFKFPIYIASIFDAHHHFELFFLLLKTNTQLFTEAMNAIEWFLVVSRASFIAKIFRQNPIVAILKKPVI